MIALVQVSWEDIAPDSRSAASMLSMNLCANDLNIASLFEQDRIKLSREVMQTISFIVGGQDQPEKLVPYLTFAGTADDVPLCLRQARYFNCTDPDIVTCTAVLPASTGTGASLTAALASSVIIRGRGV